MNTSRVWVIGCALAALLAGTADAAVIHVSAATGNDANDGLSWAAAKQSVQAGLNAAAAGDEVWVAAGTYVEHIMLRIGVTLYGGFAGTETELAQRDWKTNETILDGNQAGSVVISPTGAGASTRIDGFTIRNGSASDGGGIYCGNSSPTIANNVITGNSAADVGGGIFCYYSSPVITNNTIAANSGLSLGGGIACICSSATVTNNVILGNRVAHHNGGLGGGVCCEYSDSLIIANNTITGNIASGGGGIYSIASSLTITNNTIAGNDALEGGGCYVNAPATIANTIVAFNSSGIYSGMSSWPTLTYNCVFGNTAFDYAGVNPTGTDGNISVDPKVGDMGYGNVHIQPDSPCRNAGNDTIVEPGALDIDGEARIQDGHVDIGADESDGTLVPGGPYVIVRVSPGGDDAHDGSAWPRAKRTVQAGIDAAMISGGEVWVKAGTYHGTVVLLPYAHLYGGFAGTENTRTQRNWAANTTVLDAQKSGAVVTAEAGHRASCVDGFTIQNGFASDGGGIYCDNASPTIANNTVTGNIARWGGGIFCASSSPLIVNNVIAGNQAVFAGGIGCGHSSPTITNNTITGNTASYEGGGICSSKSVATVANTIVAFNSSGISMLFGSLTPTHNCVFGNAGHDYIGLADPTGTNGNISADPLFVQSADAGPDGEWGTVDDDYGDLHLRAGSPCVDAGSNSTLPADVTTDLDGYLRIVDGDGDSPAIVDIGAYEYRSFPPVPADFDFDADVDLSDFSLFSSCFNGPNRLPAVGCAVAADFDQDGDVDLSDFGVFQAVFNGPNRWPVGSAPPCPAVPQDTDDDGDVDLADFGAFQTCFNGPNRPWSPSADAWVCGCVDSDADNDIDLVDFAAFGACFNGPNRSPACE